MKDPKRREMLRDLYRLAESYEDPLFRPGDIDGNADWFVSAQENYLVPFLRKWQGSTLALELSEAILTDASRKAREMNYMESVL